MKKEISTKYRGFKIVEYPNYVEVFKSIGKDGSSCESYEFRASNIEEAKRLINKNKEDNVLMGIATFIGTFIALVWFFFGKS